MPQLRPIPSGYDATPAGPSAIAGGLSGFFETKAQLETLRAQRSRDELETSMLQEQRSALAARKKLAKERWDQQYGEAADRQTPLIGASTIQALRPGVDYQVTMRPSTYEMGRDATPEEQLALFADETDYLERSRRSAEMAYTVGYLEDMTAQGLVREDDSSRFLEDLGSEDADPALVHAKVKAEVAKAKRKLAQRGEAMALHGKLVEMGAPTDPESRKGYFQALTDLESSDWEVSPQEAYLMGVMNTNGDIKEAIMARDEALREAQAQLDRERSVGRIGGMVRGIGAAMAAGVNASLGVMGAPAGVQASEGKLVPWTSIPGDVQQVILETAKAESDRVNREVDSGSLSEKEASKELNALFLEMGIQQTPELFDAIAAAGQEPALPPQSYGQEPATFNPGGQPTGGEFPMSDVQHSTYGNPIGAPPAGAQPPPQQQDPAGAQWDGGRRATEADQVQVPGARWQQPAEQTGAAPAETPQAASTPRSAAYRELVSTLARARSDEQRKRAIAEARAAGMSDAEIRRAQEQAKSKATGKLKPPRN